MPLRFITRGVADTANKLTTGYVDRRYRVFRVKYHGPGNVRGSRVSVTDLRTGERVCFPYQHTGGDAHDQAIARLAARGIATDALGLADRRDGQGEVFLLSRTFGVGLKAEVEA